MRSGSSGGMPQSKSQQQSEPLQFEQPLSYHASARSAAMAPPPPPPQKDDKEDDVEMKMTPPPPPRKQAKKELPRILDQTTRSAVTEGSQKNRSHSPRKSSPEFCAMLPEDLVCRVMAFLDVASLLQIRSCDRTLMNLASLNEAWEGLCAKLWSTKIHVRKPPLASGCSVPSPNYYMDAYRQSTADARDRQHVTIEELCYDPDTHTGTVWSFRFKESAGADWTTVDPWWNSLPCRKMVFLKDGSVQQYVTGSSGGSSSSSSPNSSSNSSAASDSGSSPHIELTRPNFGNLVPLNGNGDQDEDNTIQQEQLPRGRLIQPPLSMSWRFLTRPMDLPERPFGSYLRFTVGGRDVPTYSVRRSPTGNWGFVMESCWGVYTSFEMPPRRRTETGARWVEVWENGDETLSSASTTTSAASSCHGNSSSHINSRHGLIQNDSELMDDASLMITNEIQWREAFLYNVGARVLPEGNNATDEFDRAFRGIDN